MILKTQQDVTTAVLADLSRAENATALPAGSAIGAY